MTMREKIARAICKDTFISDDDWEMYLSAADAVLDAMREPTPGMVEYIAKSLYQSKNWNDPDPRKQPGENMKDVWRDFARRAAVAMIDAAKGETE